MARRLEIELTSARDDGTWTWRAAGAREPRGEVAADLLPPGASVGQVLRADADFAIDGIDIVAVLPPKATKAPRNETLELIGTRRDEPLVTSTLVSRKGGGRDRDRDRGDDRGRDDRGGRGRGDRNQRGRGDGPKRDGASRAGDGRPERGRTRGAEGDRQAGRPNRGARDDRGGRGERRERPAAPEREAPKRLRPGRTHRAKVLAGLPEEQRPLADLVLSGGVPAVRQAVQRQHDAAGADQPKIRVEPLVALAEKLLPALKNAEWRDRAEAALKQVADVDLRDLRSVVTAGETAARDDESRALATELREALTARVDREHHEWLTELALMLEEGRIVRALRLSSRPPKAGSPLPPDIATRLAEQATIGLTAEVSQDRFATLLEAVSFSPVHARVAATSIPANPSADLIKAIRKIATRVPAVAAQFGLGPNRPESATTAPAVPAPPAAEPAAVAAPEAPAPEAAAPEEAAAEPAAPQASTPEPPAAEAPIPEVDVDAPAGGDEPAATPVA